MPRIAIFVVLIVTVLASFVGATLFGTSPRSGQALSARLAEGTPENVCTDGGEPLSVRIDDPLPIVLPAWQYEIVLTTPTPQPGSAMFLTLTTFPAGVCDDFHFHDGANIIYIQSGTIQYITSEDATSKAVSYHRPGGSPFGEAVDANTWISVAAGEWVTENTGDVWHAMRNDGDTDAVIVFASYEDLTPGAAIICSGGCRSRGP